MKHITISGKRNIDNLNKNVIAERKEVKNIENTYFDEKKQIELINKLFLNIDFINKSLLEKELNKKKNSYKQQDITKNMFDELTIITLEEIVEKLVLSKLRCHYCKKNVTMDIR